MEHVTKWLACEGYDAYIVQVYNPKAFEWQDVGIYKNTKDFERAKKQSLELLKNHPPCNVRLQGWDKIEDEGHDIFDHELSVQLLIDELDS